MFSQTGGVQIFLRIKSDLSYENTQLHLLNDKELLYSKSQKNTNTDQQRTQTFTFDSIFGEGEDNFSVYSRSVMPCVAGLLQGRNVNILLHGQTASGKTFTMVGGRAMTRDIPTMQELQIRFNLSKVQGDLREEKYNSVGLVVYAFSDLFKAINKQSTDVTFKVQFSVYEIYNENVYDLLRNQNELNQPLLICEDTQAKDFYCSGLKMVNVTDIEQVLKLLITSEANRHYSSTVLNHCSSRSHTVFMISVKQFEQSQIRQSKISFVDLAGSERLNFSYDKEIRSQSKIRNQESANINKSLFCLTRILNNKSSRQKQHIPYRDSALTKLLKSSFDDQSQTQVILFIINSDKNIDSNIQTLKFGTKSQIIQTKIIDKLNNQQELSRLNSIQMQIKNEGNDFDTEKILQRIRQIITEKSNPKLFLHQIAETNIRGVGAIFSSVPYKPDISKIANLQCQQLVDLVYDYEGEFYKQRLNGISTEMDTLKQNLIKKDQENQFLQKQLNEALNLVQEQQRIIKEQQSSIDRLAQSIGFSLNVETQNTMQSTASLAINYTSMMMNELSQSILNDQIDNSYQKTQGCLSSFEQVNDELSHLLNQVKNQQSTHSKRENVEGRQSSPTSMFSTLLRYKKERKSTTTIPNKPQQLNTTYTYNYNSNYKQRSISHSETSPKKMPRTSSSLYKSVLKSKESQSQLQTPILSSKKQEISIPLREILKNNSDRWGYIEEQDIMQQITVSPQPLTEKLQFI